jgi:hypothetical protein
MGANGQCPSGPNEGSPCSTNSDCPESICPAPCTGGICVTQQNDGCPATCLINECVPADTTQVFDIALSVPFGDTATSVTFFVDYPDGQVSLPGVGLNALTRSRIFTGTCDSPGQEPCARNTDCPEGDSCQRPGGNLIAIDFDYAVRVVVDRQPIQPGPVFAIEFDDCTGAPPVTAASFSCIIQGCSGTFGLIDGCECSVEPR